MSSKSSWYYFQQDLSNNLNRDLVTFLRVHQVLMLNFFSSLFMLRTNKLAGVHDKHFPSVVILEGKVRQGTPYQRGRRLGPVLTSLDQLLFVLKTLFPFFFTKLTALMRKSVVLSLPLLVYVPWV
jgi:hypothetical protein